MINIQYVNKNIHEVVDNETYVFNPGEIKEVPERLGKYLIYKYPNSFKIVSPAMKGQINNVSTNNEKTKAVQIIVYKKGRNETDFKRILLP